ncbi:MAG: sigma-54-dependent Fis family transcriptional regulator [Syntrophobacterales bacterium CG_4_8_14_3_um_filter_49_14]|nr:MAG: sigma-54-dependent Fis family transcriptional regulator [Syntrophobacterales bacterium CG_4_8_14_3_um_filter_49_14]
MSEKILIVDDDQTIRLVLTEALKKKGFELEEAGSAEEALDKIRVAPRPNPFDLVIMDVRLPKMSGLEAVSRIRELDREAIVIVVTAYGGKEIALEAIRKGAYDYFTKPFKLEEMEIVIERALEKRRLQNEVRTLRERVKKDREFEDIVGQSEGIKNVLELVTKVAPLDSTVLITGESGTGKELIANAIHRRSRRCGGAFIKVNCAAIPEGLFESALFGHEKGAFTGAHTQRLGKFELAHRGTIFLDEVGDMSPSTQAKVLRVLEQKELERLGGDKTLKVDVRVIAATNQDLSQALKEKRFREDLYFRLNVFPIQLPPLRERKEDIPILIDNFLADANLRLGTSITGVSRDAMEPLLRYHWPGNIRELKNIVERAATMAEGEFITSKVITLSFAGPKSGLALPELPAYLGEIIEEVERQLIIGALQKTGGIQVEAAKLLGITEKNLWKKIKKHGIDVKELKGKS